MRLEAQHGNLSSDPQLNFLTLRRAKRVCQREGQNEAGQGMIFDDRGAERLLQKEGKPFTVHDERNIGRRKNTTIVLPLMNEFIYLLIYLRCRFLVPA